MLKDFKAFAMKGNVIDMAVGVVIGASFGAIVKSFVADIIMPPIGMLLGGVDFSDLSLVLKEATEGAEAVTLSYGIFINTVIDFIIIAFAIFIVVKQVNKLKKNEEERPVEAPGPSKEEELLTEIRDLLKK